MGKIITLILTDKLVDDLKKFIYWKVVTENGYGADFAVSALIVGALDSDKDTVLAADEVAALITHNDDGTLVAKLCLRKELEDGR